MSVNKNLVFLKCLGCSKTINIDDLIELTTNSLVIGAQTIEFSELVLDVCLYRVILIGAISFPMRFSTFLIF